MMRKAREYGLAAALVFGLTLGAPVALPFAADGVAAQGNAQAGTTGGYGIGVDASGGHGGHGGHGGDATARGGNGGESTIDNCQALLLGCFGDLIIPVLPGL